MQVLGVDNITVMSNSDSIGALADNDWLDICYPAGATGRVAVVPDGDTAGETTERLLTEYLGYQPHISKNLKPLTIGSGNTGALLATVLESK